MPGLTRRDKPSTYERLAHESDAVRGRAHAVVGLSTVEMTHVRFLLRLSGPSCDLMRRMSSTMSAM